MNTINRFLRLPLSVCIISIVLFPMIACAQDVVDELTAQSQGEEPTGPRPAITEEQKLKVDEYKRIVEKKQKELRNKSEARRSAFSSARKELPKNNADIAKRSGIELFKSPEAGLCMRAFGLTAKDGQILFKDVQGGLSRGNYLTELGIYPKAEREGIFNRLPGGKRSFEYFRAPSPTDKRDVFMMISTSEEVCSCHYYREVKDGKSKVPLAAGISETTAVPLSVCRALWSGSIPFRQHSGD